MTHRAPPNDLQYGLASREDGSVCNALNNSFFKRTRSLTQWEWEFLPPHLPFDQVPYAVACDGEKIVGTQGLIILPMLSENGPFWSAKGEDTIVHPRYWGRDALVEMYKVLFSFCEQNKVPLIWGFNSRKSSFSRAGLHYFLNAPSAVDLFRSLDRRAMYTVLEGTTKMKKRFERPGGDFVKAAASLAATAWADGRALASRSACFATGKVPKNLVIAELNGPPGDEFDILSRRFVKRYGGITLHRTPAFLTWRLLENPFLASSIVTARVGGGLCGYMAFAQTADGQAHISDQLVCAPGGDDGQDDTILEFLLDAVVSRVRAKGAHVLHAHSFNSHRADEGFHRTARRMGFLCRATQIDACYRMFTEAGKLPETVVNYDDWFVTSVNTEGRMG